MWSFLSLFKYIEYSYHNLLFSCCWFWCICQFWISFDGLFSSFWVVFLCFSVWMVVLSWVPDIVIFYLLGYWIFLYSYKYPWALFWNIVSWKQFDPFESCFYGLLGRIRVMFSLQLIMPCWGKPSEYSTRCSMNYKVFYSVW